MKTYVGMEQLGDSKTATNTEKGVNVVGNGGTFSLNKALKNIFKNFIS